MSEFVIENGVENGVPKFVYTQEGLDEEKEKEVEDATQIKKNNDIVAEKNEIDNYAITAGFQLAPPTKPIEDDRTEDQVPDISNMNNVADLMTISIDEIEDIPIAEENGVNDVEEEETNSIADVPDQLENEEQEDVIDVVIETPVEKEKPQLANEKEGKDIVVEVIEVAITGDKPTDEEVALVEEVQDIPVQVDKEPQPVEEEEEVIEKEQPVEEERQELETVVPVKEEGFQLQEPPVPKRPRIPNDLDASNGVVTEEEKADDAVDGFTESVPQTPKSSIKGSQPPTPIKTEIIENGFSSRRSSTFSVANSIPQTPKSPGVLRRDSNVPSTPKTSLANGSVLVGTSLVNGFVQPGTPAPATPATPRSGAIVPSPKTPKATAETPQTDTEFVFEKESLVAMAKNPKKNVFENENDVLSTTSPKPKSYSSSKSPPKSPRSPRKKTKFAKSPEPELKSEPEAESVVEQQQNEVINVKIQNSELSPEEAQLKAPAEEIQEEAAVAKELQSDVLTVTTSSPPPSTVRRVYAQSPSPPPRLSARETKFCDYTSYDQDSHRQTVPARLPTTTSFSSWVAPETKSYQPISPWVSTANKYSNEYTSGVSAYTASYTSFFDDLVSTGPFSHSLYSTSRLLERSRSRTREHRNATRSQRSASNYYRFTSQNPAPLRTRDYSTPPTSLVNRQPSRAGSFISFLDYSNAKQLSLARQPSRGSLYGSNQALSRCSSRGNIDYYLGTGRISRVDSYVNNLNSRYENQVPSNYEVYRSSSRSHVGYAPLNQYASFTNAVYEENPRRMKSSGQSDTTRSLYESRVDELQRSLSRERYAKDRLKNQYTQVAYQLEQAVKQMELLRTNNYSNLRSGPRLRTSVYSHFYPYY